MRCGIFALPAAWIVGLAGCSSGQVGGWATTADGWTLLFDDAGYDDAMMLADRRGVRRIEYGHSSGNWLAGFGQDEQTVLLVERLHEDPDGGPPSRLILVDLRTGRQYRLSAPSVGWIEWIAAGPGLTVSLWVRNDRESPAWRWTTEQGWQQVEKVSGKLLAFADSRLSDSPLVTFPCDGWNARRTVWVRPDGWVQELLRQNDVWPKVVQAVVLTPVVIWNSFLFDVVWGMECDGLRAEDQSEAKHRLQKLIDQRKAATTQPEEEGR
ncbi:MAG: hypothetical protein BIFFINMI_03100 [Phycisphaerae bacterium]|nr:hypothetical protein [Phycisphaerae bacterium]